MSRFAFGLVALLALAVGALAAPADLRASVASETRALAKNPHDAHAYIRRGTARGKLGDHAGAILDDSAALALDPKNAVALINRANACAAQRDFRGALADYNQAIALDPRHASAFLNRGNVENEQRNYVAAIADYDAALALESNNALALYNRAGAERASGNDAAALDDYSRVIGLQPKDARALINRAVLRMAQRDWTGAQDDLHRSLWVVSKEHQVYPRLYLWVAATKSGDAAKATQDLRDYLAHLPPAIAATWPAQIAQFCVGDGQDAVAFAADGASRQAHQNKGQLAQADYFCGLKRELANDPDRALELYRKAALDGDPKLHEVILAREELKK